MRDELKKFKKCRGCDEDFEKHIPEQRLKYIVNYFKEAIDLNRERSKEEFLKWLNHQRDVLINGGTLFHGEEEEGIYKMHLYCRPEDPTPVDEDGMGHLAILYKWVDMVDEEISLLEGKPAKSTQKKKKKDFPIWCYAYFHRIWEILDPRVAYPQGAKGEVAILAHERYGIDGEQFYNEWRNLSKVHFFANSIREMKKAKSEELHRAVKRLSELHSTKELHLTWWASNIYGI